MQVKKTIRALRVERGWTLRDLSARSGIDASLLSRMENLRFIPSEEHKRCIAEAFGLDVEDIAFPEVTIARGVIDTDVKRVRKDAGDRSSKP